MGKQSPENMIRMQTQLTDDKLVIFLLIFPEK